jgi:hypothetical protein
MTKEQLGRLLAMLLVVVVGAVSLNAALPRGPTQASAPAQTYRLYLPVVAKSAPTPCTVVPGTVSLTNVSVRSSYSYVYVTGELQNNTGSDMYFARLGLTFYNPDGTVAGSGSGYVPCDWVPSGSKAPFKVFASPQASWSRCQISVSWDTSSFIIYGHDFTIINTNAYWSGSLYYVVGEVRNDTPYTWNFVKAVVTIYDTSGRVIDVNWGYVTLTKLMPGQTASFSTLFYGPHLSTMANYTVGAEGWR